MSNTTKVKVKNINPQSLLTNPIMIVLDTENKLILNNISISLNEELIKEMESALVEGITILGITGKTENEVEPEGLTTTNNELLQDKNNCILIPQDATYIPEGSLENGITTINNELLQDRTGQILLPSSTEQNGAMLTTTSNETLKDQNSNILTT